MSNLTTTTESSNLQAYMHKKALENFRAKLYFYDMWEKAVWEDGNYTIKWLKFNKLALAHTSAELAEWSTPSEQNFGATTVSATPKQFWEYVILTDMLLDTDPVSYVDGAVDEIGDNMARIIDDYVQDTIDAGTNVLFAGSATQRSDLTASSHKFSASYLNLARTKLEAAWVPKIDGQYVAIMHPLVYHDLLTETGTNTFIDIAKYSAPDRIFRWEVGSLFGVRIIVSWNVKYYPNTGSGGTVDVYPTYVIWKGAYWVPMLQSITTYITPRQATDSDPLAQRIKVWAKVAFACKVLQSDALWRIETATSLWANAS